MPSPKIVQLVSELNGQKLLLEMIQESDRFLTRVMHGPESIALATSIEGGTESNPGFDPMWPPSSPLQEVVPQSNADGDYLAGVGQCGKGHWSVIVTPLKDVLGFEFDFACRAKSEPVWLGSTYQLATTEQVSEALGEAVSVKVDVALGELVDSEDPNIKVIQPGKPFPASYPATIQWRYRVIVG